MLIVGAELGDGLVADVRIAGAVIGAIGDLAQRPGERIVVAAGRRLLPGLHDHHVHCAALSAALSSVVCGPPGVVDEAGLAVALSAPGDGWLRGVGYHESVAGAIDRRTLDRLAPDRPVRVQHRGGRMWFLNSAALALLPDPAPPGLDRDAGTLFDEDVWLRRALAARPPSLRTVGTLLAAHGITGVTDMTPANDRDTICHLARERASGALPQRVLLAGALALSDRDAVDGVAVGPAKLHLHEAALSPHEDAIAFVAAAHDAGRTVAIHCTTEVELVFALAAIAGAGALPGDRIEHASIAPDSAIAEMARLRLAICAQPHFVAERGDAYLADVAPADIPLLYRLRAFEAAGVPIAMGSDAAFGGSDPWASMAAAVSRRTRAGATIGADEALTPEAALAGWLADPIHLGRRRTIAIGAAADLCLLDRPWQAARRDLAAVRVAATWIDGRLVHDPVDQAPA